MDIKKLEPVIGGAAAVTAGSFAAIDPATGERLAEIGVCGRAEVDAAVAAARQAFKSWGKTSQGTRARALNAIADIFERDMDELVTNETLDTGKCLSESRLQVCGCAELFRYFAACVTAREDRLVQHDSGSFSAVVREPVGVVGLVLPWNAPTMLLSWKLAPALAAGNCVVAKPSSNASRAVLLLAEKLQEVLPAGVFNVITGPGSTTGDMLINHPGIDKLSFTGSTEVGRGVGVAAGNSIIPCTLELGGKSANIVFEDANLERAVQYAMIGSLSTAGEVCVAGSRLLVQRGIYERFTGMLREKFLSVRVGDPKDPNVQMGPVIDEAQGKKVMSLIQRGVDEGAKLLCGGKRLAGGIYDRGFYIQPTLFADADNSMGIAREEIFGPVLTVIPFDTEQEAVSIANDSVYGLGAAVWTKDIYRALRVSKALEAGTVWVNDYLDSSAGNPFGGYKKSGFGREIHQMAMDYYSNVKNICVSASDEVPPAF